MGEQKTTASSVNRAKTYQLVLFPLNNGATNVYYVLVLSYIATFGSKVLALSMLFASVMVTGMRLFDAVTDPIIGALMDRTNGRFGKFRPFMVIGNLIMAASILVLYCLTPLIPASAMGLRYAAFVALYAVWVIGYTFQTSCTRSGQTVLTNDPKQRPLFTIFNTVGSLLGMGAMQFFAPILAKNYEGGYASAGFFRTLAPVGIVISILRLFGTHCAGKRCAVPAVERTVLCGAGRAAVHPLRAAEPWPEGAAAVLQRDRAGGQGDLCAGVHPEIPVQCGHPVRAHHLVLHDGISGGGVPARALCVPEKITLSVIAVRCQLSRKGELY